MRSSFVTYAVFYVITFRKRCTFGIYSGNESNQTLVTADIVINYCEIFLLTMTQKSFNIVCSLKTSLSVLKTFVSEYRWIKNVDINCLTHSECQY